MSQLKKGAFLSYFTIILTNAIGLLLTPLMIRMLGDAEYGLYMLIGALIGYISVLDFGLSNTIVRFVARYKALGDRKGEENFLATTMIIYGVISTVIVVCGVFMYFNLGAIFSKLTPDQLGKAKWMFAVLIFNLAVTLPGGAFTAICSAYEHFVFPRTLNIVKYLMRSALVVALLFAGGDAVAIVMLDTVLNLAVIAVGAFYVFRRLKVRFRLHRFESPLVKEIFSYSVWIFIFAIVGQFQWQSGQVILGIIPVPEMQHLPDAITTAVAIYGVGITLGTYYGTFSTAISGVFLPRATQMTVLEASREELTGMMIRIGRFSLISLLPILGGFLLYGRQFIRLWIGDTYAPSWAIAMLIMISYTLPLVQSFANSMLEARKMFRFKALTYISLIVIGTGVGALLVPRFGFLGLIGGSTAGWMLCQAVMNVYYHKVMQLNISLFFKALLHRLLPVFIVILALGYAIDMIPGANWINLIVKIFLFTGVFAILIYQFGMNAGEKATIHGMLPAFLRKK